MIKDLISAGASLLGGLIGRDSQREQQERNIALQREFAQSGIQWKVADAKKAGIHPLYAMGAPSISPAVSVQSDPLAGALHSMGQDLGRAAQAGSSTDDRAATGVVQQLALERAGLQNELLRTQIASIRARNAQGGQLGPGVPIGPTNDFVVPEKNKPEERPPIMIGGERIVSDPGTSPAQSVEDLFGEEGPAAATMQTVVGINHLIRHYERKYGPRSQWPENIVNGVINDVKNTTMRFDPNVWWNYRRNIVNWIINRR